jgi:hypothetical protein
VRTKGAEGLWNRVAVKSSVRAWRTNRRRPQRDQTQTQPLRGLSSCHRAASAHAGGHAAPPSPRPHVAADDLAHAAAIRRKIERYRPLIGYLSPAEAMFLEIMDQVAKCLVSGETLMVAALRGRADLVWNAVVDDERRKRRCSEGPDHDGRPSTCPHANQRHQPSSRAYSTTGKPRVRQSRSLISVCSLAEVRQGWIERDAVIWSGAEPFTYVSGGGADGER